MPIKRLLLIVTAVCLVSALLYLGTIADAAAVAQPTPTATKRATRERTRDANATDAPTRARTRTREPQATDTPTRAPRASRTPTATEIPTRVRTRQPRATDEPTQTRTRAPRASRTPTATETSTRSPRVSRTPTATPTRSAGQQSDKIIGPGPITSQLLVFNPDTGDKASVTLQVLDGDGTIVYDSKFKLDKNTARLITLPPSVGNDFAGSARIAADRQVQAIVIDENSSASASDTYEVTNAMSDTLTLPLMRHLALSTRNSIIAIQNASNRTADVTLSAYDADGNEITGQSVTLAPLASSYINTNDLFPTGKFTGTAKITSSERIVAAEQTLYTKDTASFRALNATDQDRQVVIPLVERKLNKKGKAMTWSETYVRNNGKRPADITIEYFTQKGDKLDEVTRKDVPPEGQARFVTSGNEFKQLKQRYQGWARVTSNQPVLAVASLDVQQRGARLLGVGGVPDRKLRGKLVCGDTVQSATDKSTILILNADNQPTLVRVRLFKQDTGWLAAQAPVIIPPHSVARISPSHPLWGKAGASFRGIAIFDADDRTSQKLAVMVQTQAFKNGKPVGATAYGCSGY